jgi:threonine dehydrogenase-like Zn-dependent dehydrogenase
MLRARSDLFAPLVTHRLPIDEIDRAFDMLETGADGAAKIVLNLAG